MNVVFFIRAYNDIDSVAPVAYKLLASGATSRVFFVNQDSRQSFDDDFRIQFLRTLGDVVYIDALRQTGREGIVRFSRRIRKAAQSFRPTAVLYNRLMLALLEKNREQVLREFDFDSLPLTPGEKTVFLFDYNTSVFAKRGFEYAKSRGIPIGLLPHGLRTIDHKGLLQHQRENRTIAGLDNFNHADVLFSNNDNFSLTFPTQDRGQFRVVGSARYSREWSEILDRITPSVELPQPPEDTVRVCVMLSKWQYDVWKEASMWAMRYLAAQDDYFTIVKPHTRGMDVRAELAGSDNLQVVDNDAHSRRLIQWADVVLFWKSSIFIDALLLDKPLLHMHYATSFRLACADLVSGWNLNSREDIMDWVQRFREDRNARTYTEAECKACLDYYVDDANDDVLQRYVDAVLAMGETATAW